MTTHKAIGMLLRMRWEARATNHYADADALRQVMEDAGWSVRDYEDGRSAAIRREVMIEWRDGTVIVRL